MSAIGILVIKIGKVTFVLYKQRLVYFLVHNKHNKNKKHMES